MSAEQPSRLQSMMQADEENVAHCRRLFREFHPDLEFLFDHMTDHYSVLAEEIGKIVHGEEFTTIQQLGHEAGIPIEEFTRRIDAGDTTEFLIRARQARDTYLAREIRILMYLACKRQYMWGAAELLKFKVTPAMGYLRQQCESVGFLHLFLADPSLAVRWSHLLSEDDGIKFYRATQKDLRRIMESFDLLKAYEFGSATALHVRLTSLVRGAPIVMRGAPRSPRFSVPYQEIDKENPFRFLLSALNYIRNQERAMIALGKAFPDASTEAFFRDIVELQQLETLLWRHLEEIFPTEVAAIKAATTPS
jgi:hypothetical protein